MREIKDIILYEENNSSNTGKAALELFNQQLASRPDVSIRYNNLNDVLIKKFLFSEFSIELHFNPARLTSTSALTDENSIRDRECFLCYKNLPNEQKGILVNDKYLLLVNPYPIFPEHITIAHTEHRTQSITESFKDMLILSRDLSAYLTVFYNGPECGASAPDHQHFQGGTKNYLPLERDLPKLERRFGEILSRGAIELTALDDGLRKMLILKGKEIESLNNAFSKFLNVYSRHSFFIKEPLLNIISIYNDDEWNICVLLREKHRPDVFFFEGKKNFLMSPAAADLGGICITPLKKDFDKGDANLIEETFKEVSLAVDKFTKLKNELCNVF